MVYGWVGVLLLLLLLQLLLKLVQLLYNYHFSRLLWLVQLILQ